jgi:hypothetical protein
VDELECDDELAELQLDELELREELDELLDED